MPFIRLRRAATVIALLLWCAAMGAPAVADPTIQKVENKSLSGAAYARLRNLSYAQCEDRCLKDPQCVALEHYRGGGLVQRSSNCALFSSFTKTADAQSSDVGFKRGQAAGGEGGSAKKATRSLTRTPGVAAEAEPPRDAAVAKKAQPPPSVDDARRNAEWAPQTRSARPYAPPPPPKADVPASAPDPAPAPVTRSAPRPVADAPVLRNSQPVTRSAGPSSAPAAAQPSAVQPPLPPASAPATVERRAAAAVDERFHIVPVFYGTDRNQIKVQSRIGYANDRAKRLEMGRALVSVPLDHKVPNIERPRAWSIPYVGSIQLEREDPNRHFTVREVKLLTKAELINLVKQRLGNSQTFKNQSIVFIHGYNTSFDEALFRTAQISYDLQFDGAAFAYSWPSGGGVANYLYDRDSAQGAERYLYEFLQMVQNETGSTNINIIAHSMGNQMLLQVLRSLRLRAPDAISKINQIILASPDVDRDAFEALSAEITGVAKGITLYASARDRALEASRFVSGNKPRAGDVPEGGPVIVSGIDTIDITQVSTDYLALHHSGYAEHSDLLTDIGQIIRTGTRPWERRLKAYKPVKLDSGVYWRYER